MIREYVKINEEDLKLAEDFFENDKHFNEWLINVIRYYRGKETQIKTKIVQKYFNNYKKTMDFILNSIGTGKKGALVKAEKQAVKYTTLEGVVKAPVEAYLQPNIEIVNNNSKGVIADEPPPSPKIIKKSIEERKEEFRILVINKFPEEPISRLNDFIDYWAEFSVNGKLMRWEKQDAFDLNRRMATWKKNENKFSSVQQTATQSSDVKLAPDWLKNTVRP